MNERGLTLVELLVSVTMALVVFGLVATSLVAYQNDAQRSTRQNDSQSQARIAIDRIVRELRNVASSRTSPTLIEGAGAHDLIFQTISSTPPPGGSQNPTGVGRVRYCVPPDPAPGSAANEVLMVQTESWTTAAAPANPWAIVSGVSTACPSTPASLPAGATISTARLAENTMNRYAGASRAAFTYDSSTPSQITTVGIDLFVDVSPTLAPVESELRSAAFLRNQNQAPVVSFTDTPTGGGHVLLNGGGSSDPDQQQLTFKWFEVGTATPIGTTGRLDWVPADWVPGTGPKTYSVRLEVTDPGGLTNSQTRTVVVS